MKEKKQLSPRSHSDFWVATIAWHMNFSGQRIREKVVGRWKGEASSACVSSLMCFSLFEWFWRTCINWLCASSLLGICLWLGALCSGIDQVTGGWRTGEVLARCVLGLIVHFWEIFPSFRLGWQQLQVGVICLVILEVCVICWYGDWGSVEAVWRLRL